MCDRAELLAERDRLQRELRRARREMMSADESAGRHKHVRKLEREILRIALALRELRERGI